MKKFRSILLVLLLTFTSVVMCSFTSSAAKATKMSVDKRNITIALGKRIKVYPFVPTEMIGDNKFSVDTTKGLHADWDNNLHDYSVNDYVKFAEIKVTAIKTGKQKLRFFEEKTNKSVVVNFTVYDDRKEESKEDKITGFSIDMPDITMTVGEKVKLHAFVPIDWVNDDDAYWIGKNFNKKGAIYTFDDTFTLTPDGKQYTNEITVTALSKGKKRLKLTDTRTKKSVMINILVE